MDQRILITGAGGVLGHAVVERLRQGPYEVVSLRSRSECDLESPEQAKAVFGFVRPAAVIHLAGAVYGVGGNLEFPGEIMRRNLAINLNVVHAAHQAGAKRVVAMGSTAMYSDEAPLPMREADALAGIPHASEQFYGYAKRVMAMHLESYRVQFGLSYAVAVCTNIYGPQDRFDPMHGHVVPSLVYKFSEAERTAGSVEIWGDGTPTRDFIYSEDAARGIELLLKQGSGLFNLATGRSHTIHDLVDALRTLFPGVSVCWDHSKPNGQLRRAYDISRLAALGFAPAVDLRSGLAKTVSWYRDNRAAHPSTGG